MELKAVCWYCASASALAHLGDTKQKEKQTLLGRLPDAAVVGRQLLSLSRLVRAHVPRKGHTSRVTAAAALLPRAHPRPAAARASGAALATLRWIVPPPRQRAPLAPPSPRAPATPSKHPRPRTAASRRCGSTLSQSCPFRPAAAAVKAVVSGAATAGPRSRK